MEVQTRSDSGEIRYHITLSAAFKTSRRDKGVWKISFNAEDGTRIRLIKTELGWVYESIDGKREINNE